MEIVKIQKPLASNVVWPTPWLVYAEGHDRTMLVDPATIPDAVKKAMGGDHKAYFKAEWTGWNWSVHDRVGDEEGF